MVLISRIAESLKWWFIRRFDRRWVVNDKTRVAWFDSEFDARQYAEQRAINGAVCHGRAEIEFKHPGGRVEWIRATHS